MLVFFRRRYIHSIASLALVTTLATSGVARAGASDWSVGKLSQARLISGAFVDGKYRAGIEIALKGGAHTYWRNPGDAGAPPVFKFDASNNVANARVKFPAPERIVEDGSDIFGYLGKVILPVEITPADARLPVDLKLDLQYAACERICIPAEASLRLVLRPDQSADGEDTRIGAAMAGLPSVAGPDGPKVAAAAKAGAPKPTWSLTLAPPVDTSGDVFSEAPEGWFFSTRRAEGGRFDLILEQKPDNARAKVDVGLTIVDGARSYETQLHLDAPAATP